MVLERPQSGETQTLRGGIMNIKERELDKNLFEELSRLERTLFDFQGLAIHMHLNPEDITIGKLEGIKENMKFSGFYTKLVLLSVNKIEALMAIKLEDA